MDGTVKPQMYQLLWSFVVDIVFNAICVGFTKYKIEELRLALVLVFFYDQLLRSLTGVLEHFKHRVVVVLWTRLLWSTIFFQPPELVLEGQLVSFLCRF